MKEKLYIIIFFIIIILFFYYKILLNKIEKQKIQIEHMENLILNINEQNQKLEEDFKLNSKEKEELKNRNNILNNKIKKLSQKDDCLNKIVNNDFLKLLKETK